MTNDSTAADEASYTGGGREQVTSTAATSTTRNEQQSTGDTKSSTGRLLAGDIRTAGACCSAFVSEWLWLTFVSGQPMAPPAAVVASSAKRHSSSQEEYYYYYYN